jgi:hypothetical protein
MIIVEGIDGVGKTTLVDYIVEQGLEKHHFDYDEKNMDLYKKYMRVLNSSNLNKVLDRSFISEMVYGPVIRGKSKLELEQFKRLLLEYKKSRTSIIYLTAPKEILLKRREKDLTDFEMIQKFYDKLNLQYDKVMSYSMDFIDVLKLDTSLNSSEEVQRKVKRRILK